MLCLALLLLLPTAAGAQERIVEIGYVGTSERPPPPVGPLDEVPEEEGVMGARLALDDNATTGRFLGLRFALAERIVAPAEVARATADLAAGGVGLIVADLDAGALLAAADAVHGRALLFNIRAPDDALRNETCRRGVLHVAASDAMIADGLGQYLTWKGWRDWLLLAGPAARDQGLASALRRAAGRFGARIVENRVWTFAVGSARADTGHVTLQAEIPTATRGADHDVLVVADTEDQFGAYLEGRTARPRPVAGTHGLVATTWSAVGEQWGAAQLQSRFLRRAGRHMRPRDYAGWVAVRSIGEAAIRTGAIDRPALEAYLRGPDFALAAFKGQGLSFRRWDGQMRQPILIAGSRLLVSVSPQEGFLHPLTALDTLGTDESETACRF
jgi:ABC transporter substrate binding protein (PQQ-dependent alcohol dehydrogenase system)